MDAKQAQRFLLRGSRTGKLATVRAVGRPHVTPIWFVLDGDDVLFTTHGTSMKAKAVQRDPRVCMCVDDEAPLYSYVMVEGTATLSDDPTELLAVATDIARRYMGEHRAVQYGKRNSVPGELLVRVHPTKIIGFDGVSNFE